ncbi:unnamed protein product [Ilex paraguariensis]|uniref:DUF3741 domain-containing protein n=1 Tax=Ilex paraguariensis TaxID=185542 RepID=A0ABC8SPA6_9AQUA
MIAEELSVGMEANHHTPSVIARLMGLDELPAWRVGLCTWSFLRIHVRNGELSNDGGSDGGDSASRQRSGEDLLIHFLRRGRLKKIERLQIWNQNLDLAGVIVVLRKTR